MSFKRLSLIILSLFCLFGTLPLTSASASAHASPHSSEPLVIIAKDVTRVDISGHTRSCIETFTRTKKGRGSEVSTLHTPCPAGTYIQSVFVPLSLTEAQHEPYVLIPSTSTSISASAWQKADLAVQQLIEAKRVLLQPVHQLKSPLCSGGGAVLEAGVQSSVNGDNVYVGVKYQVSTSCNSITLDTAEVHGYSARNSLYWHENYYPNFIDFPCVYVGTNDLYDHLNAAGKPINRTFEVSFTDDTCGSYPLLYYYVYVGPLVA